MIRAELVPGFYFGDDAVLVAMDTDGTEAVLAALAEARRQGTARLGRGSKAHEFVIEAGAADIELGADGVVWRLDSAKAAEITELLTATTHAGGAGHHYVDIARPTATLILSRNEYV
ncbi:hypothetical protein [Mycobacterium sp. 050134]|uniref:hypothetical protein n=1 Tax=Mycobacterium sp. 050134 TaxID=3096111 RepID=UPI002ED9ECEE